MFLYWIRQSKQTLHFSILSWIDNKNNSCAPEHQCCERKASAARLTLFIVQRIVVLFSRPTSRTECRKPPQRSLKPSALCSAGACCLAVPRLILEPNSLMPSAGNLYLSYRWSSEKVSGSNQSLKTLSPLKARLIRHILQKSGLSTVRAGTNWPSWVLVWAIGPLDLRWNSTLNAARLLCNLFS